MFAIMYKNFNNMTFHLEINQATKIVIVHFYSLMIINEIYSSNY